MNLATPRLKQVIRALALGGRGKQVAHELGITEGSLKVYVSKMYSASGMESRAHFVSLALHMKLVTVEELLSLGRKFSDTATSRGS